MIVEVIVCTYNGERFIREQLLSVVKQTFPVNKVTIQDDCSSDGTCKIVKSIIREEAGLYDMEFELRTNDRNIGFIRNFALAVERAAGDVVFLCDQDDVWEHDKVEKLVALFKSKPCVLAFSDGTPIDENGKALPGGSVLRRRGLPNEYLLAFEMHPFTWLIRNNVINGAAMAMRRQFAQSCLPIPAVIPHDYWFALCAAVSGGVGVCDARLYRYRQHQGNVIGIGSSNTVYGLLGIWRQPRKPRLREYRIWIEVLARLGGRMSPQDRRQSEEKRVWLERILFGRGGRARRLGAVLQAFSAGAYHRLFPETSLARDVLSALGRRRVDE